MVPFIVSSHMRTIVQGILFISAVRRRHFPRVKGFLFITGQ